MSECICRIKKITKEFPGVRALKEVSFDIRYGEIHAIIGENGAGKSTLMNILSGVYEPTAGEVEFDGRPVRFTNPTEAQHAGISMIHQELSLAAAMTVAENIFQGRMPKNRFGFIKKAELLQRSGEILEKLKVTDTIRPSASVREMSISEKQMIEIAKALSLNAKLLIMDEPTSSLTTNEIEAMLKLMKELRDSGVSILFITHKLEEVLEVADTITVMRDGAYVTSLDPKTTTIPEMISYMVGRKEEEEKVREFHTFDDSETVLEVKDLCVPGKIRNISFKLHKGEVLGLTGLVGAGRSELLNAIFGYYGKVHGEVLLDGKPVCFGHCKDAIAHGIGLVPENRKEAGLFLKMSVRDNMTMVHARQLSGKVFMHVKSASGVAEDYVKKLSIKTPGLEQKVVNLSGGNQQKTIIARWMMHHPRVLLLDEPTHGIDVGAKAEIYRLIDEIAAEGIAVIILSSELPEIMKLSDRVMIMHGGELKGIIDHKEATQIKIMSYMFNKTESA